MKKITVAIIAIALVAVGAVFVFGQAAESTREGKGFGKSGHGMRGMGGMRHGRGMGMMLRGLDLTDAQKEQIKSIMTSSRDGNKPLRDQMHAIREQIDAATEGGNFDEGSIRQLAEKQGALHAQMIIERERVRSQVFNVLTPEQKAKAAEMKARFKQEMQERRKNRSERAEPQ